MAKTNFTRTKDTPHRVNDANLKVTKALAVPVFTGAPGLNDNPDEPGYIGMKDGVLKSYNGTTWDSVGVLPQPLGTTDNPTFNNVTVGSISATGGNPTHLHKTAGGTSGSAILIDTDAPNGQITNVLNLRATNSDVPSGGTLPENNYTEYPFFGVTPRPGEANPKFSIGIQNRNHDLAAIDQIPVVPFKGHYVSLSALQTAYPTAAAGDYALVLGSPHDSEYFWDSDNTAWTQRGTSSGAPSFSVITGNAIDNSSLATALNAKVDKVTGMGLSTNDFSNASVIALSPAVGRIPFGTSGLQTSSANLKYVASPSSIANGYTWFFSGDSKTYGTGSSDPATKSWPALVCAATGYTMVNNGVPGQTMHTFYTNRSTAVPTPTGPNDKWTFAYGINDVFGLGSAPYSDATFTSEFNAIIAQAFSNGWAYNQMIVHAIEYTGRFPEGSTGNGRLQGWNTIMQGVCAANTGMTFLDTYTFTRNSGAANLDITTDTLHENDNGYQNIASFVTSNINKYTSTNTLELIGNAKVSNLQITGLQLSSSNLILTRDSLGNVGYTAALPNGFSTGDLFVIKGRIAGDRVPTTFTGFNQGDIALNPGNKLIGVNPLVDNAAPDNVNRSYLELLDGNQSMNFRNYTNTGSGAFNFYSGSSQTLALSIDSSANATFGANVIMSGESVFAAGTSGTGIVLRKNANQSTVFTNKAGTNGDNTGGFLFQTGGGTPITTARIFPSGGMSLNSAGISELKGSESISAILELISTSKGLVIPNLTTAQRDAITKESVGTIVPSGTMTGYVDGQVLTITPASGTSSNPSGGGAGATAVLNCSGGVINTITVTNRGKGYSGTVTCSTSSGSGAVYTVTMAYRESMLIYNTDNQQYEYVKNGAWTGLAAGGGGGGISSVLGTTNRITATGSSTITIDISSTFEALLSKKANRLDQNNASTTSAQLASIISDATGTGVFVLGTAPTFTTSISTPKVLLSSSQTNSGLSIYNSSGSANFGAAAFRPSGSGNASAAFAVMPIGSSTFSQFELFATDYASDSTNFSDFIIRNTAGTGPIIGSLKGGTGTLYPIYINAAGTFNTSGANMVFNTNGSTITNGNNFGAGTVTSPAVPIHVIKTTEAIRVGYDVNNYLSITTASDGSTTFALTNGSSSNANLNFTPAGAGNNVFTTNNSTVAAPSNLFYNNAAIDIPGVASFLAPNANDGSGKGVFFNVGKSTSAGNSGTMLFNSLGSNNASNSFGFGIYGTAAQFLVYKDRLAMFTTTVPSAASTLLLNGTLDMNNNTIVKATLTTPAFTAYAVSGLPSASTANKVAIVTDASSPAIGATVAGGGSTRVFVISDGTNWIVS